MISKYMCPNNAKAQARSCLSKQIWATMSRAVAIGGGGGAGGGGVGGGGGVRGGGGGCHTPPPPPP